MKVDLFDFDLPAELIAQHPVRPREAARLLEIEGPRLTDRRVGDLPAILRAGDLLVLNDTAVLPTRFWGQRDAVAIEVTLVERIDSRSWWALARPGKRLRVGDRIELGDGPRYERLLGEVVEKDEEGRVRLGFERTGEDLLQAIRRLGAMPLPPYIQRPCGGDAGDLGDYQPVFARVEGSVAAPTASLHLSTAMLVELEGLGIGHSFITLHVGMGTFKPVTAADTDDHRMHEEWFEIGPQTAQAIGRVRREGGRIVAVGTTVVRALEANALDSGEVRAGTGRTDIFITPGYAFKTVDVMLTNFHLPRSTLLMLASAFAGQEVMRAAYAHAVRERYRFFSYGDACLISRSADR